MFDALEKQSQNAAGYDESKIRQQFTGEDFVKQLSVAQNRLYNMILRSLRNFHSNSSPEIQLYDQLAEIEVLYGKRLFDQCKKRIRKVKKIAHQQENKLILLRILKWETVLQKEEGIYLKRSQSELKQLYQEEQELLNDYTHLIQYKYHVFNFLLMSRNRMISQINTELAHYEKLIDSPFYNDPERQLSLEEELYLSNFKALYYFSKPDYVQSLEHFKQVATRIEASPHRMQEFLNEYFMALNNVLLLQVLTKEHDEYASTLKRLNGTFANRSEFREEFFSTTTCYELGIYCELGEYQKGLELIPHIEKELKRYNINVINKHIFYINITFIYFISGNYSKAITWLNRLIADYSKNRGEVVSNIHYYSHIIHLIVHYEAGNVDVMEYLYSSTVKLLDSIRSLNQFDRRLLEFIENHLIEGATGRALKNAFKVLLDDLQAIVAADPSERIALEFFDFISWAESKVENQPLAAIIQRKLKEA